MGYLLDTCTLLWALEDPESLGDNCREILKTERDVFVSAINAWEIQVKWNRGNLKFNQAPRIWWDSKMHEYGFTELPLHSKATFLLSGLPAFHKDPFDRMLICQALHHGFTMLTPDPLILQYPVPVIW